MDEQCFCSCKPHGQFLILELSCRGNQVKLIFITAGSAKLIFEEEGLLICFTSSCHWLFEFIWYQQSSKRTLSILRRVSCCRWVCLVDDLTSRRVDFWRVDCRRVDMLPRGCLWRTFLIENTAESKPVTIGHLNKISHLGSGCSTAVEQKTHDREVVG